MVVSISSHVHHASCGVTASWLPVDSDINPLFFLLPVRPYSSLNASSFGKVHDDLLARDWPQADARGPADRDHAQDFWPVSLRPACEGGR